MSAASTLRSASRPSMSRRILNWLTRLILVLLLIIVGTLVSVFSLEDYILEPLVERVAKRVTGRELSIEGGLDLSAGRIIEIHAGGISLANADWGSRNHMLSIETVSASLDPLRLLGTMPAIDRIEVDGVELLFEVDQQGISNWVLAAGEPSPESVADEPVEPMTSESHASATLAFPVIASRLTRIDITIIETALERPLEIRLDSLEHDAATGDELRLAAAGAVDDKALKLQGRIGSTAQLLAGGAVDFDLRAVSEAATLEIDGSVDRLGLPRRATLNATAQSADIARIFNTLGLPVPLSGASRIEASLTPFDDRHELRLSASIEALTLNLEARLQALNTIDGGSIRLTAGGPDLAAIASLSGLEGLPARPFTLETSAALSDTILTIGETLFSSGDNRLTASGTMSRFPQLEGTNLELRLAGSNYHDFAPLLGLSGLTEFGPEAFVIDASLDYDTIERQTFDATAEIADVAADLSGNLTEYPDFIGSRLEFRLTAANDGLLRQLLGRQTDFDSGYRLDGRLERTAAGLHVDSAVLSLGDNQLHVDGLIGNQPLRADTSLSIRFRGSQIDRIASMAGYTGFLPVGATDMTAAVRAQSDGLHIDSLELNIDRNRLQASGLIGLKDLISGQLQVALAGDDIADVLPPELLDHVDSGQSFELDGTLSADGKKLEIANLQARLGETFVDASGRVSLSNPRTDTSFRLNARGPDLAATIPEELLPYPLPSEPFSVAGGVALNENGLKLDQVEAGIGSNRLVLSGVIPLDEPTDGLSLAVAASGPSLAAIVPIDSEQFDLADRPFDIATELQLTLGVMSLQRLEARLQGGRVSGQLSFPLDDPLRSGEFDLRAAGDNLAEIAPASDFYTPAPVAFDFDARGRWTRKRLNVDDGILQLGSARIELDGNLSLPPETVASRMTLSASGESLADIGQFKGLILRPDEFRIDATLNGDADGLEIPMFDAVIGDSDLRGSLAVKFGDKPVIRIKMDSRLLDLEPILVAGEEAAESEAPVITTPLDGRVIPDLAVPVEQLQRIDLEASIRLGDLRMRRYRWEDIDIDTSLRDGELTVRRFAATAEEGRVIARFEAVAEGERLLTRGHLEGRDIVLATVSPEDTGTKMPEQDIQLSFETSGVTTRELASNLDGFAQLTGGSGRLRNSLALSLFGRFNAELISTINPFVTREAYTRIDCFAAYAEIVDGVAEIKPGAVMQTDKLKMFARGQLDLNTEQIQMRFDTSPRKGIGISVANFVNPFVGVTGTLASPRLGVDTRNAMFEGGFAYATGGLSIVAKSLFDRWYGASDPCAHLEQQAEKYLQEKQQDTQKQQQPGTAD